MSEHCFRSYESPSDEIPELLSSWVRNGLTDCYVVVLRNQEGDVLLWASDDTTSALSTLLSGVKKAVQLDRCTVETRPPAVPGYSTTCALCGSPLEVPGRRLPLATSGLPLDSDERALCRRCAGSIRSEAPYEN